MQFNDADDRIREERIEACIQKILKAEGVAPFREHVNELLSRSADPKTTAGELAVTILKDLGLTSDTLKAANSPLYNRSGRRIVDIAHAVSFLGWEAIRSLVAAARYIEHYSTRSPAVRELLVMSVLSARQAREIGIKAGFARGDETYLLALLRRIGEVLIACHCPYEYSQCLLMVCEEKLEKNVAWSRVLGFTPDEIGSRISSIWAMPPNLTACLISGDGRAMAGLLRSLASIVNCSDDLTEQIYRFGRSIESLTIRPVFDARGARILLPAKEVAQMVEHAAAETRPMMELLKIPVEKLRLEEQVADCRRILEAKPMFDAGSLAFLDAALETAHKRVQQPDFELGPIIGEILEAVRAIGFERVIFGLVNENRTRIIGRLASAPEEDSILDHFQFRLDAADGPVLAAVHSRIDVIVNCDMDARYAGSTLVQKLNPKAFALFPVLVDRKVLGCLYADRQVFTTGLERVRAPLGRVRDLLAAGLRLRAMRSTTLVTVAS